MSGGSQNSVSQQTVPDWILPYYDTALRGGANLLQTGGPQYYPGQQVAGLNPLQTAGIGSIAGAAGQPSASEGAQAANRFETSGALLDPSSNPWLKGTFDQGANAVQNRLGSEFASSGSNVLNSMPVQADQMNNLANQLYGGAYQQGLQTMTQASALAPGIDQGTYAPGQELLKVGTGVQGQTQNEINAMMNQWNYNQQLPYNELSWYSGLLGQNASPFSGGRSSGSMNNNSALTDAGGALALYSMANSAGLFGSGAAATDASAAATAAAK